MSTITAAFREVKTRSIFINSFREFPHPICSFQNAFTLQLIVFLYNSIRKCFKPTVFCNMVYCLSFRHPWAWDTTRRYLNTYWTSRSTRYAKYTIKALSSCSSRRFDDFGSHKVIFRCQPFVQSSYEGILKSFLLLIAECDIQDRRNLLFDLFGKK